MTRFRKFMLILFSGNVIILALLASSSSLLAAIAQKPLDDWVFNIIDPYREPQPMDYLQLGPWCFLGFWVGIELLRLIYLGGKLGTAFGVVTAICVLASVAGPMIGSITDQGYHDSMGFATGGAKDINNFRENIARGFLPLPSDITYEGLFYDYRFETGQPADLTPSPSPSRLFTPTYSCAVSTNPLSGESESFLAVGLKSDLKVSDFARKRLNLVVVLDISGSMSSSFYEYYYGKRQRQSSGDSENPPLTKLQAACQSIVALIDHLRPEDRLGMIVFNHRAYLAKPVATIGSTDIPRLKQHILDLEPQGATNMEEGLQLGSDLLEPFARQNSPGDENRIIFLTDAMPNTDDTSESGLLTMTRDNGAKGMFLTFIGMGVDFNSQLVHSLTMVRGANYYSVHSPADFKRRLDTEFDYMVTPMVFDVTLIMSGSGFRIKEIYGSPDADMATGRLLHIRTLFPSPTDRQGTRGGLILLKLEKVGENPAISLTVTYETRDGKEFRVDGAVTFPQVSPDYFQDAGIRKGILLARYAGLLKETATEKWRRDSPTTLAEGNDPSGWTDWERSARPLTVARADQHLMARFQEHLRKEIPRIGDFGLEQESRVLETLLTRK